MADGPRRSKRGSSVPLRGTAATSRKRRDLAWSALLMPLAWLLMSVAAYRALYQLFYDPYLWEKTEHGIGPPP